MLSKVCYIVSNIDKTVASIVIAINEAKKKSGLEIKEVFIGVAGQHIKSLQHRGEIVRDNTETEIAKADIEKLKSNMFKLITIPGEEIIHVIPQEYTVDGEDGIEDPIGMSGVKLEANFHVITAQVSAVKNSVLQRTCFDNSFFMPNFSDKLLRIVTDLESVVWIHDMVWVTSEWG